MTETKPAPTPTLIEVQELREAYELAKLRVHPAASVYRDVLTALRDSLPNDPRDELHYVARSGLSLILDRLERVDEAGAALKTAADARRDALRAAG